MIRINVIIVGTVMHRALLMPGPKFHKSCEIGCQANSTRPRMPDSESIDVFCFARVGTGTIHSSRSRSMKVLWEWSPGRHSLRNILLETSSRCYDCKKHIAEQINVQHFLPMILFVNYNSCMCFQDIFCIISHKICVSLQLQRWINSTLRNNEKSTAVLLRECHPLFTSE